MEVQENGTCFVTSIEVSDTFFSPEKLSPVSIERIDGKVTYDHGIFTLISSFEENDEKKHLFSIRRFSEDDIYDLKRFISYVASKILDDDEAARHKEMFEDWSPYKVRYEKDISKVQHNGILYKCITTHDSQSTWSPDVAPSLWVRIDDPTEEWPEWIQPVEAQTAYSKGDKVSHNGKHWVSTVDGEHTNTWEPGVFGWDEVTEESVKTA